MPHISSLSGSTPRIAPALQAGGACLLLTALAVLADAAFVAHGQSLTREGGALELASAGFYAVALALLVSVVEVRASWPGATLLAAMGLRELDADKAFTSEGILSTKIFVYDTAIWEKVLAAAVIAVLAVAVVASVRWAWVHLRPGLRAKAPWALYIAGALGLTVVSKSIDGLGRKLAPYGVEISQGLNAASGRVEEVLELGIPVLLVMAITGLRARPAD